MHRAKGKGTPVSIRNQLILKVLIILILNQYYRFIGGITPNDIFKIDGVKIKVEGNDSVVGVYLIRRADGTRVKLDRIVTNYPLKLMVLLPSLETGDYQLEIITQYCGNGKLLHQPRIIAFQHLLTVL